MSPTTPAPVLRSRAALAALCFAALSSASFAQPASTDPANRPAEITIHTADQDHVFTVEWALTPQARQLGLMFRQQMDADHGMVFDFFEEQPVSFWMRNTLIPLDMIFIRADGTVFSIAENTTPLSLEGVPSGGPVRYVLEVNGGTAERIGLEVGDTVDLE